MKDSGSLSLRSINGIPLAKRLWFWNNIISEKPRILYGPEVIEIYSLLLSLNREID